MPKHLTTKTVAEHVEGRAAMPCFDKVSTRLVCPGVLGPRYWLVAKSGMTAQIEYRQPPH